MEERWTWGDTIFFIIFSIIVLSLSWGILIVSKIVLKSMIIYILK